MHSEILLVACRDRLPRIECRGGIAARLTARDTVHLVSAAATPLGGDTISLRVVVEPGATLVVRSVAAAIALPGADTVTSRGCVHVEVAGTLDLDLQPTVVAGTARHLSGVTADIGATGVLRFRERVQIGRSGERLGFWSGSMRADVDGLPLLRHRVELGADSLADDAIAAPSACISEFRYPAIEYTAMPDAIVLELAAGGTLSTWQGAGLG